MSCKLLTQFLSHSEQELLELSSYLRVDLIYIKLKASSADSENVLAT